MTTIGYCLGNSDYNVSNKKLLFISVRVDVSHQIALEMLLLLLLFFFLRQGGVINLTLNLSLRQRISSRLLFSVSINDTNQGLVEEHALT